MGTKQEFQKGDLVHVAADLGQMMKHFTADVDAIVIGSYADQYSGSDRDSYTLHLKGSGECSWYHGHQLTLIERDRLDLMRQWKRERVAEVEQKSDLEWIFENGPEVAKEPHGASLQALADSKNLGSLWGAHGEGFTYYENAMTIWEIARPYLEQRDKAGWQALELNRSPV